MFDPPHSLAQQAFDALPGQVAILDENSNVVAVNKGWRQFGRDNGYDGGDDFGVGLNYLAQCDRADPRDDQSIAEAAHAIRSVLQGRRDTFSTDYPCHSPTQQRWFRLDVSPYRNGDQSGVVVAHSNVTALYHDISVLKAEESKFAAVFAASICAIVSMDTDGTIVMANRAAEEMFGYEAEGLEGRNVVALMPKKDARQHDRWVNQYLETGKAKIVGIGRPVVAARKDGSTFPVHLAVGESVTNGARRFTGVIHDLHEQAREEMELRQSEKVRALGNVAGQIAHDFNNLLVPIRALTQMSLRKLPENHEIRSDLEQVVTATERGVALVEQILTFSRQTSIDLRPVLLRDAIGEVGTLMRALVPETIEMSTEINMPKRHVVADRELIHRMTANLVSNAVQAIGNEKGRIDLLLERTSFDSPFLVGGTRLPSGSYAKLSISDDGPGIDDETLPRIFDPLFTTRPAGEGTGMGLAIVHGIVTAHKGAITVDSTPGEGTTFVVYLPILENL